MRPAKVAFCAHLGYGGLTCGKSVVNGGNQQISPCFLQDLHSEVDLPQMQRSYEGVKSSKCCEIVTVGRRAVRSGENRCTESGPEGLQVLSSCSLSIIETFPTLGGGQGKPQKSRSRGVNITSHTPSDAQPRRFEGAAPDPGNILRAGQRYRAASGRGTPFPG